MDVKIIVTVFTAVFLAELADKTQLAILGLAAESKALVSVFLGATAALMFATLLAVVLGGVIATYVPERAVHMLAGAAFIAVGALMLWGKL
ncbi:MAG: TMEM165/GDT1 family protein [Candidatus Hydrogenedentota bacterium]|jgi:putative Ca2+/H+ antiporter (TMEM165/GDT1 family)|nr:MAG: TMEM165/GDT1 family protein [Candidatus Hydrogenedentota bacterium]